MPAPEGLGVSQRIAIDLADPGLNGREIGGRSRPLLRPADEKAMTMHVSEGPVRHREPCC